MPSNLATTTGHLSTASVPEMPFRFLDLPPELRNAIYYEVVRPREKLPRPALPMNQPAGGQSGGLIRYKFDLAILRVNRQVSAEALDVMLKRHLFIEIVTCGVNLRMTLELWEIPVVSMNHSRLLSFKGSVMTHLVKMHGKDPYPENHIMILQQDHKAFLEGLASNNILLANTPFEMSHDVTFHNPFQGPPSSEYSDFYKKVLIGPYPRYIRDQITYHFNDNDNVSASLASFIADQVQNVPAITTQALLTDLTSKYEPKKQYLKASGNVNMALAVAARSRSLLMNVLRRGLWDDSETATDPEVLIRLKKRVSILRLDYPKKRAQVLGSNTPITAAQISW